MRGRACRQRLAALASALLPVLSLGLLLAPALAVRSEPAFEAVDVPLAGTVQSVAVVRLADGSTRLAVLLSPVAPKAQEGGEGGAEEAAARVEGGAASEGGATRADGVRRAGDATGNGGDRGGGGASEGGSPSGGAAAAAASGATGSSEAAAGEGAGGGSESPTAVAGDEADRRPRWIVLVDPRGGEPVRLAGELDSETRRLAAVAKPGGGDLLVLDIAGELRVLDPATAALGPASAASASFRDASILPVRGVERRAADPLALVRPGALLLASAEAGGGLVPETFDLPRRAERQRWGVRITSPPVEPVESRGRAAEACWAVGPEVHGKRRLRTNLVCGGAAEVATAASSTADGSAAERSTEGSSADDSSTRQAQPAGSLEAWSLLPEGESVRESLYARPDPDRGGRPHLVALTSDKLGLFVDQSLQLFPLEASRSRIGQPPVLSVKTGCPMWRRSVLGFADADGDDRDDLVLVCEKGILDAELRIEVYRQGEGGRFEAKARDLDLEGEYADWRFAEDWTGDGLPDLLVVQEGLLRVHAGTGARRRPIERDPAVSLAVAPGDEGSGKTLQVTVSTGGGSVAVSRTGLRLLGVADLGTGVGAGPPTSAPTGRTLVLLRGGQAGDALTLLSPR